MIIYSLSIFVSSAVPHGYYFSDLLFYDPSLRNGRHNSLMFSSMVRLSLVISKKNYLNVNEIWPIVRLDKLYLKITRN